MKFLVVVAGVVLVFEGLPWFLSPGSARKALVQLVSLEDRILRVIGLTLMAAGLLMVYLVRG